jgi:hypothetical protein
MSGILQILGSAAAGSVIGWFIGARCVGLPLSQDFKKRASSIVVIAVVFAAPYLLLAVLIAGVQAGFAGFLGVIAGVAIQSAFIRNLRDPKFADN